MYQPPSSPSPHAAPKKKLTRRTKALIAAVVVAAAVPFTLGGIQGARSLATQQAGGDHNATGATSASPHASSRPAKAKVSSCRTAIRDVIMRFLQPGEPWVAQELGDEGTAPCTFLPARTVTRQWNARMPTTAGTCTQLAWRSANPRYSVDATPAKPLRKVFDQVGPAC